MSIELTLLISVVSVGVAVYSAFITGSRNSRKDHKEEAHQTAVILEKLANISLGIAELKEDLSVLKDEQGNLKVEIAELKASVKQAHKRIDELMREGQV